MADSDGDAEGSSDSDATEDGTLFVEHVFLVKPVDELLKIAAVCILDDED